MIQLSSQKKPQGVITRFEDTKWFIKCQNKIGYKHKITLFPLLLCMIRTKITAGI